LNKLHLFNPYQGCALSLISLAYSIEKRYIKKTVINSTEELYQAIADALKTIYIDDAINSINHCR